MPPRHLATLAAPLIALATLSACKHDPLRDPPTLTYGKDECAACTMIINDERFAAALIVQPKQDYQTLFFDDIGDLLNHEHDHPDLAVKKRWVHNADTKRWIDADAAFYLLHDAIRTPMGSGIAAYADRSAAQANLSKLPPSTTPDAKTPPAKVYTFPEIRTARAEWMKARYGGN